MKKNSHHTKESIQKIIKNNWMRGKEPWNKGKHNHLSEEQLKRLSISHLGKPSGNKGNHFSEESKQKISESKRGKNHPNWGKHLSEETRMKIGIKQMGEKNHMWGKKGKLNPLFSRKPSAETIKNLQPTFFKKGHIPWIKGRHPSQETIQKLRDSHRGIKQSKETIEKRLKKSHIRPSGPELYLDFLLQNHFPDEWWFVGDGEIVISGLCPDFINCNGKKLIIEVFGDYWHNRKNMKHHQTEEGRKETFARPGYSTLIIWEHELADENKVIEKIKCFKEKYYGEEKKEED